MSHEAEDVELWIEVALHEVQVSQAAETFKRQVLAWTGNTASLALRALMVSRPSDGGNRQHQIVVVLIWQGRGQAAFAGHHGDSSTSAPKARRSMEQADVFVLNADDALRHRRFIEDGA